MGAELLPVAHQELDVGQIGEGFDRELRSLGINLDREDQSAGRGEGPGSFAEGRASLGTTPAGGQDGEEPLDLGESKNPRPSSAHLRELCTPSSP